MRHRRQTKQRRMMTRRCQRPPQQRRQRHLTATSTTSRTAPRTMFQSCTSGVATPVSWSPCLPDFANVRNLIAMSET